MRQRRGHPGVIRQGSVKRVNRQLERLRHVASNLAEAEEGHLRIASTPAFGVQFVPELIARWLELSPGTRFSVETRHLDEIVDGLRNLRLDLGISFEPIEPQGIRSVRLASGRFMVITPVTMDFQHRKRLSLTDIADLPFISLDSHGPLGVQLRQSFEEAGVKPRVVAQVETYHLARALAAEGIGVTITDEVTARSRVGPPVQVFPLEPALHFHFAALQNADMPASQLQQRFTRFLGDQLLEYLGHD